MSKYDWKYENSILKTKEYQDLKDGQYSSFRTNVVVSNHVDTILYANSMNLNYILDDQLHYDYLFYSVKSRSRFFKRSKPVNFDDVSSVSQYYKYNRKKSVEALKILTNDNIKKIKQRLEKGG